MIISQTLAMLIDAYRELNARKLFWITMGLNVFVVVLYASLGINDKGVTFLHWQFENDVFNTRFVSPELFYKTQFVTWGIPVWLSWIATILALVSTAGMAPDLIAAGAIETMLSKPIGRVRLFLTKYTAGLLFVALQVFIFSLGCVLVMWIRGGVLVPSLFLAVPIVLVFFSYLFAMCALIGLVTRSTVAALLLTILFWFVVFLVNQADDTLLLQREGTALRVEDLETNLEQQRALAQKRLQQLDERGETIRDTDDREITDPDQRMYAVNPALRFSETRLDDARESNENWSDWSGRATLIKTILPKTQETIALLSRYMLNENDIKTLLAQQTGAEPADEQDELPALADPRAPERVEMVKRRRSVAWVLGTSLLYEGVLLGLCCLIFRRRDF